MRGRQRAEVAVGEGEDHDVARRLAEIDRLLALVERDRRDREEVHVTRRQGRFDGLAVEALEADHHEAARPAPRRPSRAGRNGGRRAGRRPARRGAWACPRPARSP